MSQFTEDLKQRLPDHLNCLFYSCSGSEANVLATHLARAYTGNYPVVTLQNSYHGTVGAQLLTNIGSWNHDDLPRTVGVVPSCFPDMYRGPWSNVEEASEMYAKQVKDVIEFNTSGKVACLSAEPVQGAGGINPLPKGFLVKAAEHVRNAGGLLICDEVQTGFARMGTHYWGFEYQGVKPDIVVMAKTIANGIPLAAVACSREIANSLKKLTFSTFSANPVALAAGREVLKVIDEEGM